jgi:hypothetical protein
MKSLKSILIAAVAILALAAFASSSASAQTVLCKKNESPCVKANTFPSGTGLGGVVNTETSKETYFKLKLSSGLELICGNGVFGGTSTAEGGNPLPAQSGLSINAGKCKFAGSTASCSEFTGTEPAATISATGSGNGTFVAGTSGKHMSFSFKCKYNSSFEANCTYGSAAVSYQFSATKDQLSATNASLAKEAGASEWCGTTATLNAVGEGVEQVYVSTRTETVLCSSPDTTCPLPEIIPSHSPFWGTVTPEATFKLEESSSPLTCTSGLVGAEATVEKAVGALPAEGGVYLGNCILANSSPPHVSCTASEISGVPTTMTASGGGNGMVTFGSSSKHFSISYSCPIIKGFNINCAYGAPSVTFEFSGDQLIAKGVTLPRESGEPSECGPTAKMNATLSGNGGFISTY